MRPTAVVGQVQRNNATPPPGNDAFLHRRTGRIGGRLLPILLLLPSSPVNATSSRLRRDHRDTARELGKTLLQLLAV